MSIIRIGLAETKHFADGYDSIFGAATKKAKAKPAKPAKGGSKKKKPAKKK